MDEKEFRRLRRHELIEVIYQLEQDVEKLQQENEQLHRVLGEKEAEIKNLMSLEQAVERLNQISDSEKENKAITSSERSVPEKIVIQESGSSEQKKVDYKESQREREARLNEAIRKMEELHQAEWNQIAKQHQKKQHQECRERCQSSRGLKSHLLKL